MRKTILHTVAGQPMTEAQRTAGHASAVAAIAKFTALDRRVPVWLITQEEWLRPKA